jgi:ferredoxin-NADP reductase
MSEGFISRGFRGRRQKSDQSGRIPPGQYLERGFPVLSAGPTPHTPLTAWDFSIIGEVDQPKRWSWDEFRALPRETITKDIHCVTKWSKLDTHWEGVSLDTLLAQVETSASYVVAFSDGGYTTNLPLDEVSPYLTEDLRVGDKLELRGPIGGYFVWEAQMGGPLLLVAGGSGIVPLMAMLRHRAAVGSDVATRLLSSSRTYDDIIYRDELDHLAKSSPMLEVVQTLTRAQPPGWTGYSRRIDTQMLREVAWPLDQHPLAFICGPTPFVETAAASLVTLRYEPGRIKTERFGPTGET